MAAGTVSNITDEHSNDAGSGEQCWYESEQLFQEAQAYLGMETGPPRLESAQARFAVVQYLLSSSRPNKALHTFGSVVQLCHALGLHRRRMLQGPSPDPVLFQCQKRMFWCAFTMDRYISTMMGRPALFHLEDINQDLPDPIDDVDLGGKNLSPSIQLSKDCLLRATIAHAELARILAKSPKEQPLLGREDFTAHIDDVCERMNHIAAWQASLPPFLSGMIHPSSLIPPFRRQNTVLRLAYLHAIMSVTRPMILRDFGIGPDPTAGQRYLTVLQSCIEGAIETINVVAELARVEQIYASWWNTQYIAFNAISILFVYAIQVRKGRIPGIREDRGRQPDQRGEAFILERARIGQGCLGRATSRNAPGLRYSFILDRLNQEAARLCGEQRVDTASDICAPSVTLLREARAYVDHPDTQNTSAANVIFGNTEPSREAVSWSSGVDEGHFHDLLRDPWNDLIDMEFWTHLDGLPMECRSSIGN